MTADYAAQVLAEIEVSPAESPDQLRARADALMTDFAAAVAAPMRLSTEMALLRALACAVENRDAARLPVAEAEAALVEAEAVYAATAEPEAEAALGCVEARQQFEAARDRLEQAQRAGVEPAEEVTLDVHATSAAKVDQRRAQELARAQAARMHAKTALDAARAQLERARAALAAAEAALSAPLTADRPLGERFAALLHLWPLRVALDQAGQMPLDPVDKAIARQLCEAFAGTMGVVPPQLEREIRAEAAREATAQIRRTAITIPGSKVDTTIGALIGNVG
jgi:hypothetical protein